MPLQPAQQKPGKRTSRRKAGVKARSGRSQAKSYWFSPVSLVDIGSNSVRLVIYDGKRRSPTPVFNEKVLCGLGRGIALNGLLGEEAIGRALLALRRFAAISAQMGVSEVHAFATAAARDADNGAAFIGDAQAALGHKIKVLTGRKEARLAAYGVMAGIPGASGLVGDLGGGSLELVEIDDGRIGSGITLPLGPLQLRDLSAGSGERADRLIGQALDGVDFLSRHKKSAFYAVGGSWRNLARLHMAQTRYPLHVLQQYEMPGPVALGIAEFVGALEPDTIQDVHAINRKRAETLPLAARVLTQILKRTGVGKVVISAYGAREGMLYSKLPGKVKKQDPLMAACRDFARLRARSPDYADELRRWTDQLFGARPKLSETPDQRRLRHASCYLADIGWRAHPDYRGEESMTIVSQASFVGVDHPGRVFLALSVLYRYEGPWSEKINPGFNDLLKDDAAFRARVISAAQRLAFVLGGAMPGVLPLVKLTLTRTALELHLPEKLAALKGERLTRRLCDLAEAIGRNPVISG